MSRTTTEDQFQFLISCIRHSNTGNVDFAKVASDCEIVTRGAAAKRYERLMKAHGIATSGGMSGDATTKITPSPKKRKAADVETDEPETPTRGKRNAKKDASNKGNQVAIKSEVDANDESMVKQSPLKEE